MDNIDDPIIEPWFRDKEGFPVTTWYFPTLYDGEVIQIISKAKAKNFKVVLKPHVECLDAAFGGIGRWALQLNTKMWDTLFESYESYIEHYAHIADSLNVDIFVIGTELETMTHPTVAGLSDADERWRILINKIRNIYSGKITYSTAFNGLRSNTNSSPNHISFWDALDYIGFEIYRGLTIDNLNPSISDLKNAFIDIFENYIKPLSIQYQKPVIIPEVCYYSFDGVNTNPLGDPYFNEYTMESMPIDHQEQADCHRALLEIVDSIITTDRYLEGLFWWHAHLINPQHNYDWVANDKGPYFWFKPAEDVIREYWNKSDTTTSINIKYDNNPTNHSLRSYPNPFNSTTIIQYSVPTSERIEINIYDVLGNKITNLVNEEKAVGIYNLQFNASNLSSGIYFCRMKSKSFIKTNKLFLMK